MSTLTAERLRDARGRFVKQQQPVKPSASVPAITAKPPTTWRTTWRLHATLIGFAIAWHYAALWIILAAIIAAPFVLLRWLEPRYPRTAYFLCAFLNGFVSGLIGGRYYRRWRRW